MSQPQIPSPKSLLTARLAATRARLLRSLIGIDETSLTTQPVVGDWTVALLLYHLGEYDALYAQAAQDALVGRLGTVGLDYTLVDNDQLVTRCEANNLDTALLYCLQMRSQFLSILDQIDEAMFDQRQGFTWRAGERRGRGQGSIRTWVQWRIQHDTTHFKDVERWRKQKKLGDGTGPKAMLLAALQAAQEDFLASAGLIAPEERSLVPVCGVWPLQTVLGHLADWDQFFLNALQGIDAPIRGVPFDEDGDVFNAALAATRQHQSWHETWHDFLHNRQALLTFAQTLTPEELTEPDPGRICFYPDRYHGLWSALEHALDHAAILRREVLAIAKTMPQWLLRFQGPYT
jgi:hypothetical protein